MSRSAPRRSFLDPDDYVPQKGDALDNLEMGVTFECVRADTWIDPNNGTKIRYGMLIAYPDVLEGAPLPMSFLEGAWEPWLGTRKELDSGGGIQRIRRTRYGTGAAERMYEWDKKEGRYVCDPTK
jgi:hypothetical protein